jgi:hypothetical protein
MKNSMMVLIFLVLASKGYSQSVVPNSIRASNMIERLFESNGITNAAILYGIPMLPGKVVGDTYLQTHWKNSTILLYEKDKLIEGYPVRYDLYLDELEIKAKNGIKVLKGNKIKSFVWVDSITRTPSYFVNAKEYKNDDNVGLTGFFEVLTEGSLPLVKKTTIQIKKADYNIQFNVGSQDDKILKKQDFYCLKADQIIEIPSSKKKFLSLLGDKSETVEQFMKDHVLTTTKEDDLKMIFEHYNSVVNN